MYRRIFAAVLACIVLASVSRAENWPQWRGPHNDGISTEQGLPVKWSTTEGVAWTLPMPGIGGSTPAVWGDKIFLTSEMGDTIGLLCISTSGQKLWAMPLGKKTNRARIDEGTGASPSPCTDGKFLWAFSGAGTLFCFDFSGKEIWQLDTQKEFGEFDIQFGMHSTPVLHEGKLYLQLIHSAAAVVAAVNAADGKLLWKIERVSDGRAECEHSYASPVIWSKGSDAYLITHGNDYAIAHSLKDGSEIWRVGGLNPKDRYNPTLRFVASPVATPDLIVVPSAKRGPVVGLKPDAKGNVTVGNSFEQWRLPKGTPDVPSPMVHDGHVYLVGEMGSLTCINAKTGKEQYTEQLAKRGTRFRASPVFADGKVYVTSRDEGTIYVVKAGPKFELLATNMMKETFAASPAISNGRIYLRSYKTLYAIGASKQ